MSPPERRWSWIPALAILAAALAAPAAAQTTACAWCEAGPLADIDLVNPGSSVLTVNPAGTGERLEDLGITLRARIQCSNGSANSADFTPAAGVPPEEIVLYSPSLCWCIPLMATQVTDAQGWTEFTGTFRAGGCTEQVGLYATGVFLGFVQLRINSPDSGTASPCAVDASDIGALSERLGVPARYDFCFDYNDDGAIDAGDLALFATALGAVSCP